MKESPDKDLWAIGVIAQGNAVLVDDVVRVADALKLEPACRLNGTPYFTAAQVKAIYARQDLLRPPAADFRKDGRRRRTQRRVAPFWSELPKPPAGPVPATLRV
jgi:hypothetical protein